MHFRGDQQEKTLSANAEIILSTRQELHFAGEHLSRGQFDQKKNGWCRKKILFRSYNPAFTINKCHLIRYLAGILICNKYFLDMTRGF